MGQTGQQMAIVLETSPVAPVPTWVREVEKGRRRYHIHGYVQQTREDNVM